jgi:endonuclease YncB( thermonuclease family)
MALVAYWLFFSCAASAADTLPGPITAKVLSVADSNNILVRATIWLGQTIDVNVLVRGVDTPKLRGRCRAEKAAAKNAVAFLAVLVDTPTVQLFNVESDKFFGHVVADIKAGGIDVASTIIGTEHGRLFDGEKPRNWCKLD